MYVSKISRDDTSTVYDVDMIHLTLDQLRDLEQCDDYSIDKMFIKDNHFDVVTTSTDKIDNILKMLKEAVSDCEEVKLTLAPHIAEIDLCAKWTVTVANVSKDILIKLMQNKDISWRCIGMIRNYIDGLLVDTISVKFEYKYDTCEYSGVYTNIQKLLGEN